MFIISYRLKKKEEHKAFQFLMKIDDAGTSWFKEEGKMKMDSQVEQGLSPPKSCC